jgi:hypothetical protein
MNRTEAKQKISNTVEHGFATHRVMNRILSELAQALIDVIYDLKDEEIEARKTKEDAGPKAVKEALVRKSAGA